MAQQHPHLPWLLYRLKADLDYLCGYISDMRTIEGPAHALLAFRAYRVKTELLKSGRSGADAIVQYLEREDAMHGFRDSAVAHINAELPHLMRCVVEEEFFLQDTNLALGEQRFARIRLAAVRDKRNSLLHKRLLLDSLNHAYMFIREQNASELRSMTTF